MGVSLKTENEEATARCSASGNGEGSTTSGRAEGLPGITTEGLHGNERRSAPPALLPLICIVIPDHSSFSVLRETPMTFASCHFKKLKCYPPCSPYGVVPEGVS